MKKRIATAAAAAVFLLALLAGCSEQKTADIPELREPAGMEPDIVCVERGTICRIQTYEGLVLPEVRKLSFSVSGKLDRMNVSIGAEVKEGDILLTLDTAMVEAQLKNAEDSHTYSLKEYELTVKKKQLAIEIALLELEELRAAEADGSTLRLKELRIEELREDKKEWEALRQIELSEQESSIEELEKQLEAGILRAPCDGTVVYSGAADGSYASANIPLIWLADSEARWITTDYVTADTIEKANEVYAMVDGKRVEVEYQPMSRAEYLAMSESDEGLQSRFCPAEGETAEIENGMEVILFVISDRVDNTLILPSTAVHRDVNGFFVYVMENGVSTRRTVERGVYTDALTELTEGVEEGEQIYAGN